MFIITIDGLAASGKSSISRGLSKILGFQHIDVGLIFRALAFYLIKEKIKENEISSNLEKMPKIYNIGDRIYLSNMVDITDSIMHDEVTDLASRLGANEIVKRQIYEIERNLAKDNNSIISGRDTGLVFMNADLKFFINTPLEKRAHRRFLELINYDKSISYYEVLKNLSNRDKYDMQKGSLAFHKELIEIDNSDEDFLDTLDFMIKIIMSKYSE